MRVHKSNSVKEVSVDLKEINLAILAGVALGIISYLILYDQNLHKGISILISFCLILIYPLMGKIAYKIIVKCARFYDLTFRSNILYPIKKDRFIILALWPLNLLILVLYFIITVFYGRVFLKL